MAAGNLIISEPPTAALPTNAWLTHTKRLFDTLFLISHNSFVVTVGCFVLDQGIDGVGVGHYSSFILRLWVETDGAWRSGYIQHVTTRNKRRFRTLQEMLDFISQYAVNEELALPFSLDAIDPARADGLPEMGETQVAPDLDKS